MKEGFEIVVNSFKQLFNKFKEGKGFIGLGEIPLSGPIKKMEIAGVSPGGSRFSMIATIFPLNMPDIDDSFLGSRRLTPPYDYLKSFFWVDDTGSGVYPNSAFVGGAKGENDFLVAYNFTDGWLTVEMGSSGATNRGVLSTPDKFKEDVLGFFKIVTATINGLYAQLGYPAPNTSFNLKWTEPDEETEIRFGQTSEEANGVQSVELPKLSFDDLGGQAELREELEIISRTFNKPGIYKKWGGNPPRGYLLSGPPGTGKTLAAKILASTIAAEFYDVNLAEMVSKWYGEAERNMNKLFDDACQKKPSIIFFDEIDALAIMRDGSSHEASVRMLSIMLKRMSDLEPEDKVLIICATNRLKAVDPAFLRPGRIDKIIKVDLPNERSRKEIFGIHRQKAEKIAGRAIFKADWDLVAKSSEGMSGAEIAEVIRRTLEVKVRQELKGEKLSESIRTEDVIKQINSYERRDFKRKIGFNV